MPEQLSRHVRPIFSLLPWTLGALGLAALVASAGLDFAPSALAIAAGLLTSALLAAVIYFHRQARDCTARFQRVRAQLLASQEEVALQEQRLAVESRSVDQLTQVKKQLEVLAHYDGLTSLPNRLFFQEHLEKTIHHNLRHGRSLSVVYVDLDKFKTINDSLGHRAGDELLITMARRLRKCARYEDFIARLSGDEFSIILTEVARERDAAVIAQRVVRTLAEPIFLEGHEIRVTASVGVAVMPSDGKTIDTLLDRADRAMYEAKKRGRNRYTLFSDIGATEKVDPLDLLGETLVARPSARPSSELLAV